VRFKDVKRMKVRKYENNDTKKIKNVKKCEKRKMELIFFFFDK
jgi:hypothetical protein